MDGLNSLVNNAPVLAYGTSWSPGTWSGGASQQPMGAGSGQMTTQVMPQVMPPAQPKGGNQQGMRQGRREGGGGFGGRAGPGNPGEGGRNHLLGSNMPNQMQQPQRPGFFNRAAPATPAPVNPMGAAYGTPAQQTMAPTNPLNRPAAAQPSATQPATGMATGQLSQAAMQDMLAQQYQQYMQQAQPMQSGAMGGFGQALGSFGGGAPLGAVGSMPAQTAQMLGGSYGQLPSQAYLQALMQQAQQAGQMGTQMQSYMGGFTSAAQPPSSVFTDTFANGGITSLMPAFRNAQ